MGTSKDFWDKTADKYAASPVSDQATYERKLAQTQALFRADMKVLEFGCGTGSTAIEHAPHVAHIDAIDVSDRMIEIAREKAAAAGITNVEFTAGTLDTLDGADASYDVVLGLNVLHLVEDRRGALATVARLLKPGGAFVSSTVCLGGSFLRMIRWLVPLGKAIGMMPDVYVLTEAEFAEEVRDAGFTIEDQWHHGKNGLAVFMVARKP